MLQELSSNEYHLVRPLLGGQRVNVEVKAIVAGHSPGWVFVDERTDPQTALFFCRGQEGFYFLGDAANPRFENALEETLTGVLFPRLVDLGIDFFEGSGTSLLWEERLPALFAHRDVTVSTQHVYVLPLGNSRLPQARVDRHPSDSLGNDGAVSVKAITSGLLASSMDMGFVEHTLASWWGSVDSFLRHGIGYCVLVEQRAVALCYTSFAADHTEWALGVDTHPDYRQRGYATAAGVRMTEVCRERQVTTYWDVMESNTPSRKLAAKLGFRPFYGYQMLEYNWGSE